MSAAHARFHTATVDQLVPGPAADVSAVTYNLQYTKPLVTALTEQNPPVDAATELVPLQDHELVRVDLYGQHPRDPDRRVCVIGIGDVADRAEQAAHSAWFDYHASVLLAGKLGRGGSFTVAIRYHVPGDPPQRATTVGVTCDVESMRPPVEAAVAHNMPTHDECHVAQSGDLMLMRVDLHGRDPLDANRQVCVCGIADRHYRAMAAAEQAWSVYHTSLMFAAAAVL